MRTVTRDEYYEIKAQTEYYFTKEEIKELGLLDNIRIREPRKPKKVGVKEVRHGML